MTEKARDLLEARLREQPNDFRSLRALSLAHLALDRKADAIKIAQQTLEFAAAGERRGTGVPGSRAALAQIQAQTGAAAEAVSEVWKNFSRSRRARRSPSRA